MESEGSSLPIRRGMDVYSAYQDQYIGSVIHVGPEPGYGQEARRATGDSAASKARSDGQARSGDAAQDATGRGSGGEEAGIVHEGGSAVSSDSHRGRPQLGEEMGPFPTLAVGNTGPRQQARAQGYATETREPDRTVGWFAVRPGRLNPLARPVYIPHTAVRSVSMERIVLDVERGRIPAEWRQHPER